MSSIASLNAVQLKAASKWTELEVNKEYEVIQLKRLTTAHGLCVLVESAGRVLWLPKRYASIIEDVFIKDVNEKRQKLVIKIKEFREVRGKVTPIPEFL